MFTNEQLNAANLRNRTRYLAKKNRGGKSGRAGSRYEDYFIAAKVVCAMPTLLKRNDVVGLSSQPENCFVDDVVLRRKTRTKFYQLKSGAKVLWAKSVKRDFSEQATLCRYIKLPYSIHLVVSTKELTAKLRLSCPKSLQSFTRVEYFPVIDRPSNLWTATKAVRIALMRSCAASKPMASDLDLIAKTVYFACAETLPTDGSEVLVSQIVLTASTKGGSLLRRPNVKPPNEWAQARPIIEAIPGLLVLISDGIFEYTYGQTDSSHRRVDTAEFHTALMRIIAGKPQTFEDFEVLM